MRVACFCFTMLRLQVQVEGTKIVPTIQSKEVMLSTRRSESSDVDLPTQTQEQRSSFLYTRVPLLRTKQARLRTHDHDWSSGASDQRGEQRGQRGHKGVASWCHIVKL